MAATNCIFGVDCPIHGRYGCDMQWSFLQETESVIDWCIYIHKNGQRNYYVFHTETFQEYLLCPLHFQSVWNITEVEILSILSSGDPRVRLAPEE